MECELFLVLGLKSTKICAILGYGAWIFKFAVKFFNHFNCWSFAQCSIRLVIAVVRCVLLIGEHNLLLYLGFPRSSKACGVGLIFTFVAPKLFVNES